MMFRLKKSLNGISSLIYQVAQVAGRPAWKRRRRLKDQIRGGDKLSGEGELCDSAQMKLNKPLLQRVPKEKRL